MKLTKIEGNHGQHHYVITESMDGFRLDLDGPDGNVKIKLSGNNLQGLKEFLSLINTKDMKQGYVYNPR